MDYWIDRQREWWDDRNVIVFAIIPLPQILSSFPFITSNRCLSYSYPVEIESRSQIIHFSTTLSSFPLILKFEAKTRLHWVNKSTLHLSSSLQSIQQAA